MASASQIKLSPQQQPVYAVSNRTADAAQRSSDLLQRNHENHHIFFNDAGLHNHIAHHVPSIFALGASPSIIQKQYDLNASYQMAPKPLHERLIQDMQSPEMFKASLGNNDSYNDYLHFFRSEIDNKGYEAVVNEYLFASTEPADDMLARLFAGFYHPLIHLGFAIEFEQPALVAEALAQTAVHEAYLGKFFFPAEEAAKRVGQAEKRSLAELLEEVRTSQAMRGSIRESDGNKLRDGVVGRASKEAIAITSKWSVTPGKLDEGLKEMYEICAYYTFAAQRPTKTQKVDFFYIHAINSAIFFERFLSVPWISDSAKCRLLEWKARSDLVMFASRGCPDLLRDEVTGYVPKTDVRGVSEEEQWRRLFERSCQMEDDGHVPKLVRAVAAGDSIWKEKGTTKAELITPEMWLKMAHIAVDSTDELKQGEPKTIRNVGLDSAWKNVPGRKLRGQWTGEGLEGGRAAAL